MFAIWGLFALLASIQSEVAHIGIDDYLNTDFELFPDHSIQHHLHLDETLELFKVVLEDDSVLATAYDRFKKKYGERPNYFHSPISHTRHQRKHIFKDNLHFIFHHNLQARHAQFSTFEMGVNKFADMHVEEFKEERLGLIIPEDFEINQLPVSNMTRIEERELPQKFDWRDHEVISPVKDQLKCGACVMFAMTSAMEGGHAIGHGDKAIVDLSEQFILDCAIKENGYSKNNGCEGNTFPDSLRFAKDYGLTAEHLYPYKGKQGKCSFEGMVATTHLKDYKRLPDKPSDFKNACIKTGPPAIGIYIFKQFMFYKVGVYDYCGHSSSSIGGHAMAVTGFSDEEKLKYYVIKNQWGEDWGENGYIRYSSAESKCSVEKIAYSLYV